MNKTTWLSRVHHRATHSRDAFSASLVLAFLLSSLLLGVWATKMWTDKAHLAIQQKQPVQYQSHSKSSEMKVKGIKLNVLCELGKCNRQDL